MPTPTLNQLSYAFDAFSQVVECTECAVLRYAAEEQTRAPLQHVQQLQQTVYYDSRRIQMQVCREVQYSELSLQDV